MWMMGYNDGGDFNMGDAHHPFGSRKLRPLMPRPSAPTTPPNPPCLSRLHGTDFIALNHHHPHHHHLAAMAEQGKREFNNQQAQVVVSSRWNPTPEQLQTLEELYRRGTRTPSAEQIQHITAQLRRFGKIEGKNVFYWFQNHKARERQKRRRQLEPSSDNNEQPPNNNNNENMEKKESGSSRGAGFEVDQSNKNWATNTNNCSIITTLPQKTVPIQMAASKTGGTDDDDDQLRNRSSRTLMIMERNDTWHHLINSTITTTAPCLSPSSVGIIDPNNKPHHEEYANNNIFLDFNSSRSSRNGVQENGDQSCFQESTTLELFPLRSENDDEHGKEEAQIIGSESMDNTPYQFFEFLPLKN